MSEDVTAFLDRCEDVLTVWHGSGDSMRAVGYDVVDPEGYSEGYRFDRMAGFELGARPAVPVVPEIEFDPEAFVEMMRLAFREITEAFRSVVDECLDTCRHVGIALHQCSEHAERAGIIDHTLPEDPRERALYLRRHRNTGPQLHRLDGRRKR